MFLCSFVLSLFHWFHEPLQGHILVWFVCLCVFVLCCVCSFVRSCVCVVFVRSFVCSFVARFFVRSFFQSFIGLIVCSFVWQCDTVSAII